MNDSGASRLPVLASWVCRIAFAIVFAWNVQCAIAFVVDPSSHIASFELYSSSSDPDLLHSSIAAVQGLGVAFLMWNVTYPPFILLPMRYPFLGWVIIAQQAIGLVGELLILSHVPESMALLKSSIERFVTFDLAGLVMMSCAFAFFLVARKASSRDGRRR